jgi:hypothetical protein
LYFKSGNYAKPDSNFTLSVLHRLDIKTAPLDVWVFARAEEYYKNGGPSGSQGAFIVDEPARIITFYQPPGTISALAREGTHAFVQLACGSYGADLD